MNDIAMALADLREPAPAAVLPNVLLQTGLADGYVRHDGPTGPVFVAFNEHGVSACRFAGEPAEFEAEFEAEFGRPAYPVAEMPSRLAGALDRALETGRPGRLRFDLRGQTPFAAAVLTKAAEIPPGEVRPYSWVAREIDRPGAVRAVGTALGGNPIPVLIPCHRVVRADGHVGNYAYGPGPKRALLAAEGLDPDELDARADRGVRYTGTRTTSIFCMPTCRHAKRVLDKYRVEFGSADEAEAAGYRPCKVCRPAVAAA